METTSSLDFRSLIMSKGINHMAADWLQKALHPSGASPVAVCIPDQSRVPSVCMDFRPTQVISPPTLGSPDDLWDCCIWNPPGDQTVAVILTAPAPADFNSGTNITVQVLQTQGGAGDPAPVQFGKIFDGSSAELAARALTISTTYANSLPASFRTSYRSVTASLTASSLNNQGTVYSTQFARDFYPSGQARTDPSLTTCAYGMSTQVPFDENSLNLLSPSAETRPAKEGVYMPLRLCGPTQPFIFPRAASDVVLETYGVESGFLDTILYRSMAVAASGPTSGPSFACSPPTIGCYPRPVTNPSATQATTPPWADSVVFSLTTPIYLDEFNGFDLGYDNVSQGMTIFRGLSAQATVTLQVYVGLEMIPRQDSPVRSFVRTPGEPDMRAIQLYYEIANSMAVSYPARYNSLGSLLPLLVTAARAVIPHIPFIASVVRDVYRAVRPAKAAAVLQQQPRSKQQKRSPKNKKTKK